MTNEEGWKLIEFAAEAGDGTVDPPVKAALKRRLSEVKDRDVEDPTRLIRDFRDLIVFGCVASPVVHLALNIFLEDKPNESREENEARCKDYAFEGRVMA